MLINDNGIPISAVLEKSKPDGHAPLMILLHGFGSSKEKVHTIQAAEAMREAGFDTLRADLFGHGESGGEFGKHTVWKWIENTIALVDYARSIGYEEIWLSGHSQGGLAAAFAASMERDHVRGLILRAPAFLIPEGARKGSLLGFRFDPVNVPDRIPIYPGVELEGNYIRTAQALHAEDAMDRFEGPVLILHGNEDDTVPPEDSVKAAERYRNAKLVIMKDETHHFDRHPDEMQEIIRGWLAKEE